MREAVCPDDPPAGRVLTARKSLSIGWFGWDFMAVMLRGRKFGAGILLSAAVTEMCARRPGSCRDSSGRLT